MLPFYRAAIAASAALVLSACASVKTTETALSEASKAETSMSETSMSETSVTETIPSPEAIMTDTGNDPMPAAAETLLYGAMTKWELQTFIEVVQSADFSAVLEADGPVTVFAPNNDAFGYAKIGAGADVPFILNGHIVPGALDAKALMAAVAENGAPITLTSLSGADLTVYVMDGKVKVAGPGGTLATVTQADMLQSNGVMHQISSVLLP